MEKYSLDDLSELFDEKINSKMKILEKVLEEKLNTKVTILDIQSDKNDSLEITEELIDQKIKSKLSLSIKYWYPTLITVMLFAAGAVWWFYSQINPLKESILIQQNKTTNPTIFLNEEDIVEDMIHLVDIKLNDSISDLHQKTIKDIAWKLNNERKDLVIIIAGYTNKSQLLRKEQFKNSELAAKKIATIFQRENIPKERIFFKGHGPDIPIKPPEMKDLNVCLIICDIYGLMALYNIG